MRSKLLRVVVTFTLSALVASAVITDLTSTAYADGNRILAEVTIVKDDTVHLNKGTSHGVSPGMLFDIYREAKVVFIPMTKEKVLVEEKAVGRIIVTQVSAASSTCTIVKLAQGLAFETGDAAVNVKPSLAPDVNAPPVIETMNASKTQAHAGQEIVIDCAISDVNDKFHIFAWSCDYGQLSANETVKGRVRWLCPAEPGEAEITVTVTDPHGAFATRKRQIKCLGPGPRGKLFRPTASFGETTPRFQKIAFASFDEDNHLVILDSLEKRLITLSDDFNIEKVSALYGDEFSFTMAKISDSSLYAVDSKSGSIIRFKYEGDIFRRKPETVYGARGSGNGYFGNVADIQVNPDGKIYILDKSSCAIHIFSNNGIFICSIGRRGDKPGEMRLPTSMAMDIEGNFYVSEYARHKILKFGPDNQFVEEYDLGGKLGSPVSLRYNRRHNNLVVLERQPHVIRVVSTEGKQIAEVKDSVNPLAALNDPDQLAVSRTGEIFVISSKGTVLQRFSTDGKFLGKMGGENLAGVKAFAATPEGDLYLLESLKSYVYRIDRNGWITARFGGIGPNKQQFKTPIALCSDNAGNAYVLDKTSKQVMKFTSEGKFVSAIGKPGSGKDEFEDPVDIYSTGEKIYVLQYRNRWCSLVYNPDGRMMQLYPDKESETSRPSQIAVDKKGNSFIFTRGYQIEFFNRDGAKVSGARNMKEWLTDLAVGPRGDIYGVSPASKKILRIDPTRAGVQWVLSSSPAARNCAGIAFDSYGRMYIYDQRTKAVVRLSESSE